MLFDKVINTAFSLGAAVVVFGAWAKLEHKEFSDDALTVGMLVEAGIFCIYAFLEWRKKPEQNKDIQSHPSNDQAANMDELTDTMKQTNQILNKVFKAQ
jgi:hypothetical protein